MIELPSRVRKIALLGGAACTMFGGLVLWKEAIGGQKLEFVKSKKEIKQMTTVKYVGLEVDITCSNNQEPCPTLQQYCCLEFPVEGDEGGGREEMCMQYHYHIQISQSIVPLIHKSYCISHISEVDNT